MPAKVAHDQFVMRHDRIVHVPTGATFRKVDAAVVACEWGVAGETAPGIADYRREDVQDVAQDILTITRARPIG